MVCILATPDVSFDIQKGQCAGSPYNMTPVHTWGPDVCTAFGLDDSGDVQSGLLAGWVSSLLALVRPPSAENNRRSKSVCKHCSGISLRLT
jgi:hypothetical protein